MIKSDSITIIILPVSFYTYLFTTWLAFVAHMTLLLGNAGLNFTLKA